MRLKIKTIQVIVIATVVLHNLPRDDETSLYWLVFIFVFFGLPTISNVWVPYHSITANFSCSTV